MNYPESISKEEISLLPLYQFQGITTVIEDDKSALVAIDQLKKEAVLGFDTETRASFKKGEYYDVSLLQLGTISHVYLFRLSKVSIYSELMSIFTDSNIIKAGVAIHDDLKALKKLHFFEDCGFVDLAQMAKERKMKNFGLRALTAIFLSRRLSKKEQTSNWDRVKLSPGQIHYAACDAAVGYQIYHAFME